MKTIDIPTIQQAIEQYKANKQQKQWTFPLKFLTMCKWDKIAYDEALIKYTAGTLDPVEQQPFVMIYTTILEIIADVESMCAFKKMDYYFYKTALEQFAGSGLVSSKQQRTIQERLDKFKKQQELINNSGLEIK